MNREGMLEELKCKECNSELGKVNPAEAYAGTYTGLCYNCERAPVRVLTVYTYDNAKRLSYPPTSPSWRRDRKVYIAYEDCKQCLGLGRIRVYQSFARGGPYYKYCTRCYTRYYNNRIDYHNHYRKHEEETFKPYREKLNQLYLKLRNKYPHREQYIRDKLLGRYKICHDSLEKELQDIYNHLFQTKDF